MYLPVEQIIESRAARRVMRRRDGRCFVLFATDLYGGGVYRLRVSISVALAESLEWCSGVRLQMLIDRDSSRMKLQRDATAGYTLRRRGTNYQVGLRWAPGLPSVAAPQECAWDQEDDGSLQILLPEVTVWEVCARDVITDADYGTPPR